jgi:hypothetical protein
MLDTGSLITQRYTVYAVLSSILTRWNPRFAGSAVSGIPQGRSSFEYRQLMFKTASPNNDKKSNMALLGGQVHETGRRAQKYLAN